MKGKSTSPEFTQSYQSIEKLPWEKLYAAHEEGGDDPELRMAIQYFDSFHRHLPDPIDPPITLGRLISTATALRPIFGEKKWVETEQGRKRATEVAAEEAYELLSECARLMTLADIKKEKRAKFEEAHYSQVKRHQKKGGLRLNEGVKRITGYSHPQDAQSRFVAFLEVFYGEVLYCQAEAFLDPWMPHTFQTECGDYKAWARKVYASHQERGFLEEEVVFYAEKFKKLEKEGFLEKSTARPLSRTKTKKGKPKGVASKHP